VSEGHDAFLDAKLAEGEARAEAWRAEHLNDEARRFVEDAEERFGADLRAATAEMLEATERGTPVEEALELWERRYGEAEAQFHRIIEIAAALTAAERGDH
jgi:hypothetical protein